MKTPTPYYATPDGRVRLYHGDCRKLLPLVAPPSSRVLALADPMYGIGAEVTGRHNKPHIIRRGSGKVSGTRRTGDRDYPHIDDSVASDVRWLLAYQRLAIWGYNHIAAQLPTSPSIIVWDKREDVTPDNGADGEICWSNLGGPLRIFRYLWRGVCQAGEKSTGRIHPFQKPEAIYRWLFAGRGRNKPLVQPGDLIAVPYAGSVQIPPAMELGLEVVAIDVEREYLDTIIKHRIEPALRAARQIDLWAPRPPHAEQPSLFAAHGGT